MDKNSTQPVLLQKMFELLERHRSALGQERVYWQAVGMALGELIRFGRHTATQNLMALGVTDGDWSGGCRLFGRERIKEQRVSEAHLGEIVRHVPASEPCVMGLDGVQIPRGSLKMAGTSWLKAPRTPVFRVGIHRDQRFVHVSWLTPLEEGYSRAIRSAFACLSTQSSVAPQWEWEAGAACVRWTRIELDEAGRESQLLFCLADGSYDILHFWSFLPH